MGRIRIEGVPGYFPIEGDEPTEEEFLAIQKTLDMQTAEGKQKAIENVQRRLKAATGPIEGVPLSPERNLPSGPFGVVPKETRADVRGTVEQMPGILGFAAEVGPAAGATVAGFKVGLGLAPLAGPFSPLVPPATATVFGVTAELYAQEFGVSPRSDLNIWLTAGGQYVGKGVGYGWRSVKRMGGKIVTTLPFIRAARSRMAIQIGYKEIESIGAKVLAQQQGLLTRSADELYGMMRKSGLSFKGSTLKNSQSRIDDLLLEMEPIAPYPEVQQARSVLENVKHMLSQDDVSIDTFVKSRQLLGAAVDKAEKTAGIRLGTAKQAYKALSQDLDDMAAGKLLQGRGQEAATVAKAATRRAKIEFAVKDFEQMVARHSRLMPGESGDFAIVPSNMLKDFVDITNPKSAKFDKNFVSALGDENIALIRENLSKLAEIAKAGSPAGPGSIVVRGIGARTGRKIAAAITGAGVAGQAGPIASALGALGGASAPEMMTAMMANKKAFKLLDAAARMGQGEIHYVNWILAGTIALRSVGEGDEPR